MCTDLIEYNKSTLLRYRTLIGKVYMDMPVAFEETEQFAPAIVLVRPSAGLMRTFLHLSEKQSSISIKNHRLNHRP